MFSNRISTIISATTRSKTWTGVLVAAGLAAHSAPAGAAAITSVTITGNPSQPGVSITGTGFGAPPTPDPPYPPPGAGTDPAAGYDYGTNLYFADTNSPSSQDGPWTAGLNDHKGVLSLIGLRLETFTDSQISFTLGDDYSTFYQPKGYYVLGTGDSFAVHVNGLTCSGTISFSGMPIPCLQPAPRVHAVFVARWRWNGPRTALVSLRVTDLPPDGAVAVRCVGRGCPRRLSYLSARHITGLQRLLRGRTLYAGTRLVLTVSAPRQIPERVQFVMRRGRTPAANRL